MISSSPHAFKAESSTGDPLGLPSVSKKKKNASQPSFFAGLMEKAKTLKEGVSGSLTAESAPKKNAASLSASIAAAGVPAEKKKAGAGEKSAEAALRDASLVSARAAVKKDGTALAAAQPPFAQSAKSASQEAVSRTSERVDEESANAFGSARPLKAKAAELGKKGRANDAQDGGSDLLAASAASAASSLASSQTKSAKKDEPGGKPEEKSEAVEGKKKDKRKERLEIEVIDQRKGDVYGGSSAAAQKGGSETPFGESSSQGGADLVLSLREGAGGSSERSEGSPSGSKTSFADALARELRETYNGDIVKHASVVLKDGGDGLVRLALQPEALGSVKIKLEVADNKIAGRILVETEEALKAFGKELQSLEQAFVDGGFDGASLELALSSGDTGSGSGRRDGADAPRPFFSDRLIASEYDSSVPSAEAASGRPYGGRDDALIDMLA